MRELSALPAAASFMKEEASVIAAARRKERFQEHNLEAFFHDIWIIRSCSAMILLGDTVTIPELT